MKTINISGSIRAILLVACSLSVTLSFNQCASSSAENPEESEQQAIPVKLASEEIQKLVRPLDVSGTIVARKKQRLSFKTGGIIQSIYIEEGDTVREGQVLATLKLDEIRAKVKQARLAVNKAARHFERMNNLYNDSVVTLEQYQNAQTAVEIARADLERARYNLRFSKIRAPEDGLILQKMHETSEMVQAGTPLFTMASKEEAWKLRTGLTDKEIVHVTPGNSATIQLDAYPSRSLGGKVSRIAHAPDPQTGLYEVEISLQPNDLNLKTGFFAEAHIIPDKEKSYVTIPIEAVTEGIEDSVTYYTLSADQRTAIRKKARVAWIDKQRVVLESKPEKPASIILESPREPRHLGNVMVVKSNR